jgi:TolB-like protein
MSSTTKLLLLAILVFSIAGCGSYRSYVNEEADFGFYKRIGVLPFSNLSNDKNASEKVTSSFLTEMLIGTGVEVAAMGDMVKSYRNVIKDDRSNLPDQITGSDAIALGKDAQVEGILVGAVREYGMTRSGQTDFPLVSIIVRLIDSQSGKVVWTYEITRKGGPKFPIFSFGEVHTVGDMTTIVCRKAVQSLAGVLK